MKKQKGEQGYLAYRRKQELIKTLLLFALSFGIFFLGLYSTGTTKNLLTIVSVLGMLPACQGAVSVILYFRAAAASAKNPEAIREIAAKQTVPCLYDLYFTSYEKNYPAACALYKNDSLYLLSPGGKELSEHLKRHLAKEGLSGITINLSERPEEFSKRISSGSPSQGEEEKRERVYALLKAISL